MTPMTYGQTMRLSSSTSSGRATRRRRISAFAESTVSNSSKQLRLADGGDSANSRCVDSNVAGIKIYPRRNGLRTIAQESGKELAWTRPEVYGDRRMGQPAKLLASFWGKPAISRESHEPCAICRTAV